MTTIHLFQVAYSQETRSNVSPGFAVLDNLSNMRPDWFEYWPIRQFLKCHELDDQAFYGFFSPKFLNKTGLSFDVVQKHISSNAANADVVLFSPQPDMGAFFLNVFEQGEFFDPGLIDAYEAFLAEIGRLVPIKNLVMDSRQSVFSNYFAARPSFWREWLTLNEAMFHICETRDDVLSRELRRATAYPGAVQRKVFLQERAASFLLATQPQWRTVAYNPFGMAWSMIAPFRQHAAEAVMSDALKSSFRDSGFPEYLAAFQTLRDRVFFPAQATAA